MTEYFADFTGGISGLTASGMWESLITTTVFLSAIIWARFELLFSSWPWRLLRNDQATLDAFAAAFWSALETPHRGATFKRLRQRSTWHVLQSRWHRNSVLATFHRPARGRVVRKTTHSFCLFSSVLDWERAYVSVFSIGAVCGGVSNAVVRCCLDPDFSEPVRRAYPDVAAVVSSHFDALMRSLAKHLRCTNMSVECFIAELRQSVPYSKQKPLLESLNYNGLLTQVLWRNV